METRYFYHSFPRRGGADTVARGCDILRSILDIGLLLVPEYIEWRQPTMSGQPRIFPVLQQRVCFTELAPSELPKHAEKFGPFALEFEVQDLRALGATPVFYIPQPTLGGADGNAVGVGLVSIAMDSANVLERIAGLHEATKTAFPAGYDPSLIDFKVGFTGNPGQEKSFRLKVEESKAVLEAMGYMITPWKDLHGGARMLMNFFYPTDNPLNNLQLEYYRQREWRIAGEFAIKGTDYTRNPTAEEKEAIRLIDPGFFEHEIKTLSGAARRLEDVLVLVGLPGSNVMSIVRRLIAPEKALRQAKSILSSHYPSLTIEPIEKL